MRTQALLFPLLVSTVALLCAGCPGPTEEECSFDEECDCPDGQTGVCEGAVGETPGTCRCVQDGSDGSGGSGGSVGSGGTVGSGGGTGTLTTGLETCTLAAVSPECECDPFDSAACDALSGSNLTCVVRFIYDTGNGNIIRIAELDGSDGTPGTECITNSIQVDGLGDSCTITFDGIDAQRGSCSAGLDCDQDSGNVCVPYCTQDSECTDAPCNFYTLTNEDVENVGRCTVP